jgi:hypothetical protein
MSIACLSNLLRIDGFVLLVRADEAGVHDPVVGIDSHDDTVLLANIGSGRTLSLSPTSHRIALVG